MKKITVVFLILLLGVVALSADEVKVPLEKIKSSCYGEVDITKSKIPLSTVRKACISSEWLKKNLRASEKQKDEKNNLLVNGSFEKPTISDAVAQGAQGDGNRWAADFDVPGWNVEGSRYGYNKDRVVAGHQVFFLGDPQRYEIEQTLDSPVVKKQGIKYELKYWRFVDGEPEKSIEFRSQLIVGEEVVDSERVTDKSDPKFSSLSYVTNGSHIGDKITVKFRADTDVGWTTEEAMQKVLIDDVTLRKTKAEDSKGKPEDNFNAFGAQEPTPNGYSFVEFPNSSYNMDFDDGGPQYYIEDRFSFTNRGAETMDNNEVHEILFDSDYSTWIEQDSSARKVVRLRGTLVSDEGDIAHTEVESGSPYGPGDWVDEWYYIYPNGLTVRKVKIYTGYVEDAMADWGRRSGTLFETQETGIGGLIPGHQPTDDIKTEALTLAKMDGEIKRISFKEYPPRENLFPGANVQIVNLESSFHPFTIVAEGDVSIEPYYGPPKDRQFIEQTMFVAWPRHPHFENSYATGLSHVNNWDWYKKTSYTVQQVYLIGLTDEPTEKGRVDSLIDLAKSWQYPPEIKDVSKGYEYKSYDMAQKAYIFKDTSLPADKLVYDVQASLKHPLVNPCFIITNWESKDSLDSIKITVNGKILEEGEDYRTGIETKENATKSLVVWLKYRTKSLTNLTIEAR